MHVDLPGYLNGARQRPRIEQDHVPACEAHGLGIIPWGPLAGGFLTGKYRPDGPLTVDQLADSAVALLLGNE